MKGTSVTPPLLTEFAYLVLTMRVLNALCRSDASNNASKITEIMIGQYNEVSILINSAKRKLTFVCRRWLDSPSMAARAVSSHESFNEAAASGSPAKPTFLLAWRSTSSPLITSTGSVSMSVYLRHDGNSPSESTIVMFCALLSPAFRCRRIFRVMNSRSFDRTQLCVKRWHINLYNEQ